MRGSGAYVSADRAHDMMIRVFGRTFVSAAAAAFAEPRVVRRFGAGAGAGAAAFRFDERVIAVNHDDASRTTANRLPRPAAPTLLLLIPPTGAQVA